MVKAENLSEGVVERLLSDNKFHIQKQDKLFKSLTGIKWKQAIEKISEGEKTDFCNVNNFVVDVVRARNRFIHEGSKWLIDRELSTNCMKNLNALIKKYIRLNNQYVCPYYQKNL